MPKLTYAVLTDPASLEASEAQRSPSKGTVYLIVTNTTPNVVEWLEIEVTVPVGSSVDALTPSTTGISPTGQHIDTTKNFSTPVSFGPQGTDSFKATAGNPRGDFFFPGDCVILTLAGVTVTVGAGPVVLSVAETLIQAGRTPRPTTYAAVALVKATPQPIPAPRDFRPDKALLEPGDALTLSWEGSDDFDYRILSPAGSDTITGGKRSWSPTAAPTRATTYTLQATSRTTPPQEHFLTTTVQVRYPVLETLTATTGIDTPWVQGATKATKGRVTFTGAGAELSNNSSGKGSLTAGDGHFDNVFTPWIGGPNSGEGTMTFTQGGVIVWRTGGTNDKGTVTADKADLTGVNTDWVQGRNTSDGWIEFPPAGVNVFQGAGQRQWGTVAAGKADLDDLATRRALVKERLTLQGGLTVDNVLETHDGPPRLVVHGQLDAEGDVDARRNVTEPFSVSLGFAGL
ncbi:hypothetical protein AB0L06_42680 [Spirillospora sp. NPDC052269]